MGRHRSRLPGDGVGAGQRLSDERHDELLRLYLEEIAEHPTLSVEEEANLGRQVRAGDHEAGERLIRSNLQLVVAIARRYRRTGLPLLDLIQEGNLGLMEAVDAFDADKGFAFRTFAIWWIRQGIARAIEEHGDSTTLAPIDVAGAAELGLQRTWDEFVGSEGRQPTVDELAGRLGVPVERIHELLATPPSFDDDDDDDGDEHAPGER